MAFSQFPLKRPRARAMRMVQGLFPPSDRAAEGFLVFELRYEGYSVGCIAS